MVYGQNGKPLQGSDAPDAELNTLNGQGHGGVVRNANGYPISSFDRGQMAKVSH